MNSSSPSGSPARRPLSAQQAQEAPAPTLTDAELLKYKQDNLLNDDDYAIELRLQIAFYGEKLLNRARYEVDLLEREVVALASVFNEFLEEVKTLDSEINQLSSSINAGKLQAAQELDATIKQEVQVVVEQLRLVPQADIESVDVLYQNLDALQDNFLLLQKQIQTLQALGVKTDHLQKNLPALEKGIDQFGKSIESHQMSLLMGAEQEQHKTDYEVIRLELKEMLENQSRAMIQHLRQAQTQAHPQEIDKLRRNQAGFEAALEEISAQIDMLRAAEQKVDDLVALMGPVVSGLKQFERALASNQFLKITERIYADVAVVIEQIREAQQVTQQDDLDILNENVDVLYENCDAFADELDELAEQGLDIKNVLEHYDVLRVNLEQFERVLQDAANRIGLRSGQIQR